ncbi:MalY/PatB family protein [uncultured Faecalibaculum sp.]|uniref:MalY/PatB family protein n=3 Tax=uncultured Faecalibaculum sp. TaxID=1729681 RepID=UPI00261E4BCC|nr:MalY/PatB family protein [uncultured Faecalibaculum sp.]
MKEQKQSFDQVLERRGSNSLKWDNLADPQMIPMWVADMDFQVMPEIQEALHKRAEHGIFGYAGPDDSYRQAVCGWMQRRHQLEISPESILCSNGVVSALKTAIQAFSSPGDAVAVITPVYYPFYRAIESNGRKIHPLSLTLKEEGYVLEDSELEKLDGATLLLFCNPHNPVGKVWTEQEQQKIGAACLRYGVKVVSDEIHGDFIRPGIRMVPFWNAVPGSRAWSILCTAPSKTFNLAALWTSNILIDDPAMREAFAKVMDRNGTGNPNIFGIDACRTACSCGDQWVDDLNEYIDSNFRFMKNYLSAELPQLKMIEPQGTYLAWVDCRNLGMNARELEAFMKQEAHLLLDEGEIFGKAGAGFERFNIACPRPVLEQALDQLRDAVHRLEG